MPFAYLPKTQQGMQHGVESDGASEKPRLPGYDESCSRPNADTRRAETRARRSPRWDGDTGEPARLKVLNRMQVSMYELLKHGIFNFFFKSNKTPQRLTNEVQQSSQKALYSCTDRPVQRKHRFPNSP